MAKTISDQTREYFCYIKQKVRKGEKVIPWLSGTKRKPLCMAYGNADDFKAVIKQLNLCEDSILDVYIREDYEHRWSHNRRVQASYFLR